MEYREFFRALKLGINTIYLITGEETFLRDQAVEAIRKSVLTGLPELNEAILENPEVPALRDACETLPMMADRRLVIARGLPVIAKERAAGEAEQTEALLQWLPSFPESCCLVILQQEMDGRKKAAQQLKKSAAWLECKPMSDTDLQAWVQREFQRRGKKATEAGYLISIAGRDMRTLLSHIERLSDYVQDRDSVTRVDVDALVQPDIEQSVFRLADALIAGQGARVQAMARALVDGGESRIGLIAILIGQFRQAFHACALMAGKKDMASLSENLRITGYALTMLKKRAAHMQPQVAQLAYETCVDADFMIKSGQQSEEDAFFALMEHLSLLFAAPETFVKKVKKSG